jgi:triosephosphate isomerase
MNLTRAEAVDLAQKLAARSPSFGAAEVLICPPMVYLDAVNQVVRGTPVALGAQNVYHQPKGAFTGEISAAMLVDVGCRFVILGHSERRHVLGESDQEVNRKLHAVLGAGLVPIVCVGETLAEREAGATRDIVAEQFYGSLAGLAVDDAQRIVVAYEPVWAIGTGKNATPEQAEEVHADLRTLLKSRYNASTADTVRILYGGSVNAENAAAILAQANVDGALVGGASLKADSFMGIIGAASGRSAS